MASARVASGLLIASVAGALPRAQRGVASCQRYGPWDEPHFSFLRRTADAVRDRRRYSRQMRRAISKRLLEEQELPVRSGRKNAAARTRIPRRNGAVLSPDRAPDQRRTNSRP